MPSAHIFLGIEGLCAVFFGRKMVDTGGDGHWSSWAGAGKPQQGELCGFVGDTMIKTRVAQTTYIYCFLVLEAGSLRNRRG